MSTLVTAMAMVAPVVADPVGDERVDVSAISAEAQAYQKDVKALEDMTLHQGLILTPEQVISMLENNPDVLATANERIADQQALLATSPAKFEVVGDAQIHSSGGGMPAVFLAGGSFNNGTDVEALLNYSASEGGRAAFIGAAADGDVQGALAYDVAGRTAYGVYGGTSLIDGYGVYARNWAPAGDSSTTGGGVALFATGSINGAFTAGENNDIDNHVAVIENRSMTATHVLALSMPSDLRIGPADNFITFYHGGTTASDAQGSIEGVFGGGINYNTSSADFAEWIPRRDPGESLEAGDIVGIAAGKVSRDLSKAGHVQVISTASAFTGNGPGYDKRDQYALVSMMGQVPVKVAGAVKAGDYIVASGKNDGAGMAISADKMMPEDYRVAVGRAWEFSDNQGIKLIKAAVGLGANDAYAYMRKQDQHIASLKQQLSSKIARLDRLAAQMEVLTQKVAYIQSTDLVAKASR